MKIRVLIDAKKYKLSFKSRYFKITINQGLQLVASSLKPATRSQISPGDLCSSNLHRF